MSNKIEKRTKLEVTELYDTLSAMIARMLTNTKYLNKDITGMKVNGGQIIVYTNNGSSEEDEITKVVDANLDDVNVEAAEKYLENYPLINIIGKKEKKNRKYIVISVERTQIDNTDGYEMYGKRLFYRKKIFYIDESEESLKDPRELKQKMADLQVTSVKNFAIHKLLTEGYRSGRYIIEDEIVYGKNTKVNEYEFLGSLDRRIITEEYRKEIDFEALSFPFKENGNGFLKIPSISNLQLRPELLELLNKQSGIIVIDSFNAYDLINSNILEKQKKIRQIWYSGSKLPSRSRYNVLNTYSENSLRQSTIENLKNSSYDWILDDNNILTIQQAIELSNNSVVIMGSNLTDTKTFFRNFDSFAESEYRAFFNRCIYMGSLYEGQGEVINKVYREIIFNKDYNLLGEVLDKIVSVENIIYSVIKKIGINNFSEIIIKDKKIFIIQETDSGIKEIPVTKVVVENNEIIKMIFRNEESEGSDGFIEKLNENGAYMFHLRRENPEQRGTYIILKVIVFKNGNKYSVTFRPLIDSKEVDDKLDNAIEEKMLKRGVICTLIGPRESGKSTLLKKLAYNTVKDKKVYVYDPDYDFSTSEFMFCEQMMVHRDEIKLEFIKKFDPDIVFINAEIKPEQFVEILGFISEKTKVYLGLTYDIINTSFKLFKNNYNIYKLLPLRERGYIFDIKTKKEIEINNFGEEEM